MLHDESCLGVEIVLQLILQFAEVFFLWSLQIRNVSFHPQEYSKVLFHTYDSWAFALHQYLLELVLNLSCLLLLMLNFKSLLFGFSLSFQ